MYNDLFSTALKPFESLPEPAIKANELCVASLEKLADLEMSALRYYVDLGIAQLKEAVKITTMQDVQAFLGSQVEVFDKLRQKMADDAKALTELSADFKAEFGKLAEESAAHMVPNAI